MLATPDFPPPITPFIASFSLPSLSFFPSPSLLLSFFSNSPQVTFPCSFRSSGLFDQSRVCCRRADQSRVRAGGKSVERTKTDVKAAATLKRSDVSERGGEAVRVQEQNGRK